jgi:hypothetical protein
LSSRTQEQHWPGSGDLQGEKLKLFGPLPDPDNQAARDQLKTYQHGRLSDEEIRRGSIQKETRAWDY